MASKRALTFTQWQQEKRGVHKGSIPFHYLNGEPLYREEDTYPLTNYSEFKRGRGKPHRQGYRSASSSMSAWFEDALFKHHPEAFSGEYFDDFDDNCGAINH